MINIFLLNKDRTKTLIHTTKKKKRKRKRKEKKVRKSHLKNQSKQKKEAERRNSNTYLRVTKTNKKHIYIQQHRDTQIYTYVLN